MIDVQMRGWIHSTAAMYVAIDVEGTQEARVELADAGAAAL